MPLRYLRLETVFSTPADNPDVAQKAIRHGSAPMARLMERHRISVAELAERLEVDTARVQALVANPQPAGAVMLDGEDAAAGEREAGQAAAEAATLLSDPGWPGRALRLWRPPLVAGQDIGPHLERLALAPRGAGSGTGGPARLDAVVIPKVSQPEEVRDVGVRLAELEQRLDWPEGCVGTILMVETARAVGGLTDIVDAARPRLCGLLFGSADYAADLGVRPGSAGRAIDWARAAMANAAAIGGVLPVDAMTLEFPVTPLGLSPGEGRERFLSRVALAYGDALNATGFGMRGKLVGHPAQLFAARLAFDSLQEPGIADDLAGEIEAYAAAVATGRGVTVFAGRMVDRATVEVARAVLRSAVANGRFGRDRAVALGVIAPDEKD